MKKILLVATGAFLMAENAMCSQPGAENSMAAQQGEGGKVKRIIESVDPTANVQFPAGTPIFERNAHVIETVEAVDKSGNKQNSAQEEHQLRIISESQQLLDDVLRALKRPQMKDAETNTFGNSLEGNAEYIMRLLDIGNDATPYDFLKALLYTDFSKIIKYDNSSMSASNMKLKSWDKVNAMYDEWQKSINQFINKQERQNVGNEKNFLAEYRKCLNSQSSQKPLMDSLFLAINELKPTPTSISELLPMLFKTGHSAAPDSESKKWYEGIVKITGEKILDTMLHPRRLFMDINLDNGTRYEKGELDAAMRYFCGIPYVLKSYPNVYIDQVLDNFRALLSKELRSNYPNVLWFEVWDDSKINSVLSENKLQAKLNSDFEWRAKECARSLFNGSGNKSASSKILSIILGESK